MSALILTDCRCGRAFTAELWTSLKLEGHVKSGGQLLEVRSCPCSALLAVPVCDGLVYGARFGLVATEDLPRLAELAWSVVASAPPDRLHTPAVEYARMIERQLRAELERRQEAARVG